MEPVALWECQCPAYGCPCQRNGRPTHGTCHASDFTHISKGHYGDTKLDGLNVVMVGDLVDANSDRLFATLYLDDNATENQSVALTRIVEYMNGAYVSVVEQSPVPFNTVKRVPIKFVESADRTRYSLEIPTILQEQAVLKRDKSGEPLFSMTAMDLWSNTVHNADPASDARSAAARPPKGRQVVLHLRTRVEHVRHRRRLSSLPAPVE